MRLRTLGWSVAIVLPLLVGAGHLHARRAATADAIKEVNRCLAIVRVATSRRRKRSEAGPHERAQSSSAPIGRVVSLADLKRPA